MFTPLSPALVDDEPIPHSVTPEGNQALSTALAPHDCDLCRKPFQKGDAYFRVSLGMDDTPSLIGAPLDHESTVEETSELVVCRGCEPAVAAPLEALLATLWAMRRPDPLTEDDIPTVTEPVVPTERSA